MKRLLALTVVVVGAAVLVGAAQAASIRGQYIVVLKDATSPTAIARAHASTADADVFAVYRHALKGYAARLSPKALRAVVADRRVRFVSQDGFVSAVSQALPTGIDRVDGELSSTISGDGVGAVNVNVAVLDTGIDIDHPDLNVVGGVGCSTNTKSFDDDAGHGTAVAGVIGARDNDIGVVGIAPGAPLWAVKVLNKQAYGTFSAIACGVDWVTRTRSDDDMTNDIAVANMSLGGPGSDDGNCGRTSKDALHLAICNSVAAGVTYIVAAMNEGVDFKDFFPASYDEVLTITALRDYDGQPGSVGSIAPDCPSTNPVDDGAALFSNYATLLSDQAHTIAAPGVCILSTAAPNTTFWGPDQLYGVLSGTSMAAPHVAGTIALCIATRACKGAPAVIIKKIRKNTADYNLANPGYGFLGDPLRPSTGKYYGYLVRAGLY
jgi:subtilisin